MDHVGDHIGPVKQGTAGRGALLLGVNLGDDGLPGYCLVEEFHHRLGTQHCTGAETEEGNPREGHFYTKEQEL